MRSVTLLLFIGVVALDAAKRHHHHHKKHHHAHQVKSNDTTVSAIAAGENSTVTEATQSTEKAIVDKMKALEQKLDSGSETKQGRIIVNGPLPSDFNTIFSEAVAEATGCKASDVKVLSDKPIELPPSFIQMMAGEVEVTFEAPGSVVDEVLTQAADVDSKLVNGPLNSFLVAKEEEDEDSSATDTEDKAPPAVDFDASQMPYGELEPFGREDTAQELTEQSIKESDEMVDQLERAEVAEEKRSVFRAITRLRGAAIASFDGIARSQTGNIDEYNHNNKWRDTHPLHHLAQEESDVSKWAFPSNAD